MRHKTYILRGVSILVAAVTAAGCSGDKPSRGFTVPKALCGTSVPADALSQLLPASGKHLTTETDDSTDGVLLCTVSVDNVMVLTLSRERIDAGDSARHILFTQLRIARPKFAEGTSIAYADDAAVSLLKCRGAGVEEEDISTLIKVLKPARANESAMKDLISSYTATIKKQGPCKRSS